MIFTFERSQPVDRIVKHTAYIVESDIGCEIIIEHVGRQLHVAVYEPDLFTRIGIEHRHLVDAGILKFVGIYKQRVALLHAHIAECVERIGSFIEMRAVAVHEHVVFAKHHIPGKHLILRIGRYTRLLKIAPRIGMLEKHLALLIPVGAGYHRAELLRVGRSRNSRSRYPRR